MTLDEFYKRIEKEPFDDYIVRFKSKYSWEKEYRYHNELYICDGDGPCYYWLDDWDEGQEDVIIIGYVPVRNVDIFRTRGYKV